MTELHQNTQKNHSEEEEVFNYFKEPLSLQTSLTIKNTTLLYKHNERFGRLFDAKKGETCQKHSLAK
jgi:hypothetical protein